MEQIDSRTLNAIVSVPAAPTRGDATSCTARILAAAAIAMAACALSVSATAAVFTGSNTGAIPDNSPAGRNVSFSASGLTGPVGTVSLSMTMTHTWMGDLRAELISPAGIARMVVFSRTGATKSVPSTSSSDLNGTYVFSDDASGDFWTAAISNPVPTGAYRASSMGTTRSNVGGCVTSLNGVFGDLTAAEANGTWTLNISDLASNFTGSISAASLTIDAPDRIFANGFDTPTAVSTRCLNKVQADFTGDGLTDYAMGRNVGGTIRWTIQENLGNGTASPAATVFDFGVVASGRFDTADIDGDRIADAMAWNSATGTFSIRRSSRPGSPPLVIALGQPDDNSLNSGDYDGDVRDDLAVFNAPASGQPAGPIQMQVRNSATGLVHNVGLGTGVQFDQRVSGGFDFTGDALADIAVQRADPGVSGGALYTIYDGRSGTVITQFPFQLDSDNIVPGNHVGSAPYDITAIRNETISGVPGYSHLTRDTATGVAHPVVRFGMTGDAPLGGDYDGDGLSDYAIWRPSATVGLSQFQIRLSTNTATVWMVPAGEAGDFPIASSRVK